MIKARKTIIPAIFLLTLSFTSTLLFAKTEALFSPKGSIRDAIIQKIISCEKSIDIAAFVLTSGDIADKLSLAKERGVKIRIVIDDKQRKKKDIVLEFLRDEGFDLHYLKGNVGGFMHNTFAIFDNKTVITGSYNWTEYSEKFNYENAIITDDENVVNKFRDEFKLLYNKSLIFANKTASTKEHSDLTSKEETAETASTDKPLDSKPNSETTHDTGNTQQKFLKISFNEFDKIFGGDNANNLTKAELKDLWNSKFKGKHIKWKGKVCYKGVSLYDWNKVGITHKNGKADVQLMFDPAKKTKVQRIRTGNELTYTGKLDSLRGFSSPYKVIDADTAD